MRIAILPNITRCVAEKVTRDICAELNKLNTEFVLSSDLYDYFKDTGAEFLNINDALSTCDAVIAVGGDGSIIRAAKQAVKFRKPILGVNAGRLAFMAGVEDDELNLLHKLIEGDYHLDKRLMLKTEVKKGENTVITDYSLNECFITNGEKQRMTTINVALNGSNFNGYLCDGIIVATPTGSTAYSLSAGGPVVDPELESILFTPVCPHSLVGRSLIFRPDDIISVSSPDGESLYFSNDGASPIKTDVDSIIEVSRAEFTADFIRLKSDNFIEILYKKLAQRR